MENKLVKLAKRGDRKALEKLLQNNYSILMGYVIKMTLDKSLAEDITQDTMLKAVLNIKNYKQKGKFSTWLITIATNQYRDYLRKNKRLVYGEDKLIIEDDLNLEETVTIKNDFETLKKLLLQLPEEKRMVLVLKHYYGYSYKEISKIMKCPIGTVRSRLHYCIDHIRLEMKGMN